MRESGQYEARVREKDRGRERKTEMETEREREYYKRLTQLQTLVSPKICGMSQQAEHPGELMI